MTSPREPATDQTVADAPKENWVDRYAPKSTRPYLRLARADRPIGTWLLLIPSWWGLLLGATQTQTSIPRLLLYMALFAIGSLVMRGAGCTYNDIIDRDFDSRVERTRSRPIPSGQVSVSQAWAFLVLQCLIGLAVLLTLSPLAIYLGIGSLALIATYPFMKRITYWPQIWLGITFNWGGLMGFATLVESIEPAAFFLYAGSVFWTIGYDTIYAHQDKEDDIMIGVKSSAIKLAERTPFWLGIYYGAMIGLALISGLLGELGILYFVFLILGAGHLYRQIKQIDIDNPDLCLQVFKSNRDFGLILCLGLALGAIL
jgi:4-hydroxybenzoate polyprenyltransferase